MLSSENSENEEESSPQEECESPDQNGSEGCVVVGIGSSAGGLQALSRFLDELDTTTDMAFVLIQHLDPSHESLMSDLLGKHTEMEVVEVSDPCPIEPNHVYMIPPNKYLRIEDHALVLTEPVKDRGMRMPIDYFFRSLAEQCRERSVCIVLTGTGSDGTQGLKEVKMAGGLTIAQDPETAEYDGMPRSAIASGMIDRILPIKDMPEVLSSYTGHPYITGDETKLKLHESSPDHFKSILSHLHAKTGYDFRCYKKGTLNRRIQRRIGLQQMDEVSQYLDFLREDREEINALFGDLLIGVTRFFRDVEVWDKLVEHVIRPLVGNRKSGEVIRIWVPGCSTGEEAYTLAILVFEEAEKQSKSIDLQLFATDLDQNAVAVARAGIYPANIGLDLSDERLSRYFIQDDDQYRVTKNLRESCVFAAQNLISDPPFSNLDLISCRNLLIYLEKSIQEKITQLFHFALAPEGYLLLGSSESTNRGNGLFEPISKSCRIFRKIEPAANAKSAVPVMPRTGRRHPVYSAAEGSETGDGVDFGTVEFVRKVLLDEYAPASILIDREHTIHYFHGPLMPYLVTPSGQPSTDLFSNLITSLEVKVRGLIRAAENQDDTAAATTQPIKHGSEHCPIRITVEPLQPVPNTTFYLITFMDIKDAGKSGDGTALPPESSELSSEDSSLLQQLEYELQATREDLQSTIEELETSNEELKASNEEGMSMNEELQSTNEELETSREELQSLNEELSTVNSQLNEKVDELEDSNNDLSNLISSTQIATIFLDSDLRIRRFTPSCRELLNIIPTDVGRPISDLSPRVNDDNLLEDSRIVLDKLQVSEKEVRLEGAGWYFRRILPFRTADNQINGVVITLTDIGAIKKTYELLEIREHQQACVSQLGQLALSARDLGELFDRATKFLVDALGVEYSKVLKLDPTQQFLTIESGVGWDEKLTGDGKVPTGIDSQAGYTLQTKGPVIVPNLPDEKRFQGPELLINHEVHSGMSVVLGSPEEPWGVLGTHSTKEREYTVDDVNFFRAVAHILTEAIRRETILEQLEYSEKRLLIAKDAANLGTHDFDVERNRVHWDERSREFWGVEPDEEVTFQTFMDGIHEDDREMVKREVDQLFEPGGSQRLNAEFRVIHRKDKKTRWIAATALAFFREEEPYRAVGTHLDITEKRNLIDEQARWAERLEEQVIERTSLAEKRADDLRLLASQITTAEERARKNVAQIIHDDVQQLLVSAKMRIPDSPDKLASPEELKVVSEILDKSLTQLRSLVSELSPPVLQDDEFDKALEWLARHMEKAHSLKVELTTEGDLRNLDESLGTLIFNVVRELLFNAVKHSGVDCARVAARVTGETLEITVEDEGKGFDVENRARGEGGFGLFSIDERIQAFNGTVDMTSSPGDGAKFVVRVPLARQEVRQREGAGGKADKKRVVATKAKTSSERLRIIIADDHEIVREGFVRILSAHSDLDIVAIARDGEEAVKLALTHHPDLILMDITMPKLNGIEATQEIKAKLPDTVIIGLSMHEEGVLGDSMRQAGANAYLQKDMAVERLVDKIRELFPESDQDS